MSRRDLPEPARAPSLWLALALALGGCSDPPVPVDPPPRPPSQPAPPPPDTGPLVSGRVRLRGALVDRFEGVLWISLRQRGGAMPMPLRFRAFALTSGEISDPVDGERTLAFDLRDTDTMAADMPKVPLPPEIELRAVYDPDGKVETKDGQVVAQAPVTVGDRGIDLVLDLAR